MMRLFNWITGRSMPKHKAMPPVHWIPAEKSPFGVEILDCKAYAAAMLSTTSSPEIAAKFCELRNDAGEELRGRQPQHAKTMDCKLTYRMYGIPPDGALFKAAQMEDKWDIYLYDGHLYFCRSWTGQLVYRAKIELEREKSTVTCIESAPEGSDPLTVEVVDFLIKSHLMGLTAAHPLIDTMGRDPYALATWSFTLFGRRGLYGTMGNTLKLKPLEESDRAD